MNVKSSFTFYTHQTSSEMKKNKQEDVAAGTLMSLANFANT